MLCLLASDFPSENPRTQARNFPYTLTLAVSRTNQNYMNFIKSILITIVIFSCASSGILQSEDKLVGKWNGTDFWNNKSDLIFTTDKNVSMTLNGEILGGENFEIKGTKAELKYEIDSSKDPIWIDFIAIEKESKIEKGRIKGIMRFIDENNVELLMNFNGVRFENFDKENEQSIVKIQRKK
ncbi:hypothetical protein ACFQ1R_13175 [Mariniflexile jejuense]|uniref:Lipocalin-like domain-containing protein n=1 Tax=Mariniflexile jejuense TaxID=1173582 RepID=A0ABW3JL03_9FLAO